MKLVCISDVHCADIELPPGDILVVAGDLTYIGTVPQLNGALRALKDQRERRGYKVVIIIAGNHDRIFEKEPTLARTMVQAAGFTYLEDQSISVDKQGAVLIGSHLKDPEALTFYGAPWQPSFGYNWAFNLSRGDEIKKKWDLIPEGIDVLITHGPPQEILDFVPSNPHYSQLWDGTTPPPRTNSTSGEHTGCWDLLQAVRRVKPQVHVFGHIHAGYGREERDGTTFINASIMTENYEPMNKPIVIDVEPRGNRVEEPRSDNEQE